MFLCCHWTFKKEETAQMNVSYLKADLWQSAATDAAPWLVLNVIPVIRWWNHLQPQPGPLHLEETASTASNHPSAGKRVRVRVSRPLFPGGPEDSCISFHVSSELLIDAENRKLFVPRKIHNKQWRPYPNEMHSSKDWISRGDRRARMLARRHRGRIGKTKWQREKEREKELNPL